MGLGVATLVDPAQAGLPASPGTYCWSGRLNTFFWIDPQEDLLGVFLVQRHPATAYVYADFPVLVYQALIE